MKGIVKLEVLWNQRYQALTQNLFCSQLSTNFHKEVAEELTFIHKFNRNCPDLWAAMESVEVGLDWVCKSSMNKIILQSMHNLI